MQLLCQDLFSFTCFPIPNQTTKKVSQTAISVACGVVILVFLVISIYTTRSAIKRTADLMVSGCRSIYAYNIISIASAPQDIWPTYVPQENNTSTVKFIFWTRFSAEYIMFVCT